MWEAHASLKQCIEVILHIQLKQCYCEILESLQAVFAKLSWNFHLSLSCCSVFAGNRQYITGFVDILSRYDLFWWLVPEKIAFCLQRRRSGQNIDISFGPNRALLGAWWWSTPRSASHSKLLHLMLSYLVNARNQAELTELSRFSPPCVEFCLVGSQRRSRFWVSHHTTYCTLRSLTSYRPVVHTYVLSLLRARSQPPRAARDRAHAAAGPSTFWRRASQRVSLGGPCCSY